MKDLLNKLNNMVETYPIDYMKFVYKLSNQINEKQSLEVIYNELFNYFETIFIQKGYFMPESSYYCGFSIGDLKKPIYECVITAVIFILYRKTAFIIL